jgi:hypothetical protein
MTPDKSDVLYGTLGLMVIKTLEALGPLEAQWQRAASIVERFLKISENPS